jgi:hypothetical protein
VTIKFPGFQSDLVGGLPARALSEEPLDPQHEKKVQMRREKSRYGAFFLVSNSVRGNYGGLVAKARISRMHYWPGFSGPGVG